MAVNMFRYLQKYVGKYRVKAFTDISTDDVPKDKEGNILESFDDLYIPCKKGTIRHSYKQNMLAIFCDDARMCTSIVQNMNKRYPEVKLNVDDSTQDPIIYFESSDIDKVAKILHAETKDKKLDPFTACSSKDEVIVSLKRESKASKPSVPSKEYTQLMSIISELSKGEKVQYLREVTNKFLATKKLQKQRQKYPYDDKMFIYSQNLWPEYLHFVQEDRKNN